MASAFGACRSRPSSLRPSAEAELLRNTAARSARRVSASAALMAGWFDSTLASCATNSAPPAEIMLTPLENRWPCHPQTGGFESGRRFSDAVKLFEAHLVCVRTSVVPPGLAARATCSPGAEAPGYWQSSLRGFVIPSFHAKTGRAGGPGAAPPKIKNNVEFFRSMLGAGFFRSPLDFRLRSLTAPTWFFVQGRLCKPAQRMDRPAVRHHRIG